ncbi:MAG: hypothetical protein RIE16_06825 [Rhodospirillales bacterium]
MDLEILKGKIEKALSNLDRDRLTTASIARAVFGKDFTLGESRDVAAAMRDLNYRTVVDSVDDRLARYWFPPLGLGVAEIDPAEGDEERAPETQSIELAHAGRRLKIAIEEGDLNIYGVEEIGGPAALQILGLALGQLAADYTSGLVMIRSASPTSIKIPEVKLVGIAISMILEWSGWRED